MLNASHILQANTLETKQYDPCTLRAKANVIILAHVNFITKILSLSLSYLTLTMARHSCTPTDPGLPPRSSAVFRCYDLLIRVWDATSDLMIRRSDSMEEHHGKV